MSNGESTSAKKPKRPRRRWLQYSLRAILLLMLVVAVSAWWFSVELGKARREEQAIAALQDEATYGLSIGYAHQRNEDGAYNPSVTADNYGTFREWLGDAFFDEPRAVNFSGEAFSDDAALRLRDLPTLEVLSISTMREPVSLEAAQSIAALSHLTRLEIMTSRWEFSSESLAALAPLPELENFVRVGVGSYTASDVEQFVVGKSKLRWLQFSGCEFQPGAAAALAQLPSLQVLNLSSSQLTFADMEAFAESSLMQLNLTRTGIRDEDLKYVAAVPSLKSLLFRNDPITDEGLRELSALENLQTLILQNSKVTGVGFDSFSDSKSLQEVGLSDSQLSAEGFVALGGVSTLEKLTLKNVEISTAALTSLQKLPKLRELQLTGTALSDDDLTILSEFPSLESLDLAGTQLLTDGCVAHLVSLKLTSLDLPKTVTAAIVPDLLRMTSLEQLRLPRGFSAQATSAVKAGLPNCLVVGGTPTRPPKR